jgi:hypothetical protein
MQNRVRRIVGKTRSRRNPRLNGPDANSELLVVGSPDKLGQSGGEDQDTHCASDCTGAATREFKLPSFPTTLGV